MALDENGGNGMIMPVAPFYGSGNGNGNNGFGGDWAWIILLLLLGWGNNGNGFGNGGGFGGGVGGLYPWMNQSNQISEGFQNQLMNDNITSIRDGINNISTQICNTQMADMQQMFALQSQFADCCCENRLANCQTQNIIQNEGNMTRFADANNTRDLLQNQTANTQAILDKLCQLELDAKNDKIADLERQLTMANLAASQIRQTSDIQNNIVNELRSCPIPSQPVYGSQPIFTCSGNNGCGCNGGF